MFSLKYKMFSILLISLLMMLATAQDTSNITNQIQVKEDHNINTAFTTIYLNEPGNPQLVLVDQDYFKVKKNSICASNAPCQYFDLILLKKLDREKEGFIRFKYKFSNNAQTYFGLLIIIDVNDNPPVFVNKPYATTIPENFTLNAIITGLNIQAIDADQNPDLNFTLKPAGQNSVGIEKFMKIDKSYKGDIILIKQLDYETRNFFEYTVFVNDGKYTINSSVWIQISDVQDMPPTFTSSNFVEKIKENLPKGTVVINVTAIDQDRGIPNKIRYEMVKDLCSAFSINSSTGALSVKSGNLDRENQTIVSLDGVCTVEIMAYELANNQKSNNATKIITIFVEDVNDNKPFFNKNSYNASVREGASEGSPVTLSEAITVRDNDTVEFSKFNLTLKTMDNKIFTALKIYPPSSVSKTNVALSVNNSEELDYEKIQEMKFKIVATDTDSNNESEVNVTLKIDHKNEFPPKFEKANYKVNVSENEELDNLIIINATDEDRGIDGEVTYALVGDSHFKINNSTGMISVSNLDYEKITSYTLTVEATDQGNKKATASLEVSVEDVNDNIPIFKPKFYVGRLKEGKDKFENEVIVTATDADKPNTANSIVKYSLVNVSQGLLSNFSIDNNGKITPNYINAEDLSELNIQLSVKATDSTDSGNSSLAAVNITVLDVNDNSPKFLNSVYNITVKENATTESFLLNIVATDDDKTDPFNQLTYRLKTYTHVFRIDSGNGNIYVNSKLDREKESSYILNVEAIDGGSPPLSATTTVNVIVEDVNDVVPVLQVPNTITLFENITIGSLITKINATDKDSNNKLVFNISKETIEIDGEGKARNEKSSVPYFQIDPHNGTITLKETLDREKFELIVLNVEVTDQNSVSEEVKTAKGDLKINILDINDCSPVFENNFTLLELDENYPTGNVIATLTATDNDKGDSVTYEISDKPSLISNVSTKFNITIKGEIYLNSQLDREELSNFTFYVVAKDSLSPTQVSTATVSVVVKDINDNAPEFQGIKPSLSVPENTTVNSTLVTIKATDKDIGIHANIIYSLAVIDGNSPFEIGEITGNIILTSELDREKVDKYNVLIFAKDNYVQESKYYQSGWKQNTTTIIISVTDVNDNHPVFKPDKYSGSVVETESTGNVLTVTATDKDIGENSKIEYALQGNESNFFTIDKAKGILRIQSDLKNKVGLYYFNVTAIDQGIPHLSSTARICINVTDVNNNYPEFSKSNDTVNIPESTCAGTEIYNLSVTDKDFGVNKEIKFKVENGVDSSNFKVNEIGSVILAKQLDYEDKPVYQVEIKATDSGDPPLSTSFTLFVKIENINDEPPEFDKVNQSMTINEGPPPISVGTVKARNSEFNLCYTIDNIDDASYFIVKNISNNASIETIKDVNFETTKSLKMVVIVQNCISVHYNTCSNNPSSNKHNKLSVEVFIKDVDDNPPIFKEKQFNEAVAFDISTNDPIIDLAIYVEDADVDLVNKQHKFSIESFKKFGNDELQQLKNPFKMKNSSVYRGAEFDSAVSGYIEMTVKVYDSNGKNDAASLKVHIISVTDNVRIVFGKSIESVRTSKLDFLRFLESIFDNKYEFMAGKIDVHKNMNGEYDVSRTDMFIYAVNRTSKEILPAHELVKLLDMKRVENEGTFMKFSVQGIQESNPTTTENNDEKSFVILIAVIVLISLILIIIIFMFYRHVKRLNRKLEAAVIKTKPDDVNEEFPGANKFSGHINPIYINHEDNEMVPALPEKVGINSLYKTEVDDGDDNLRFFDLQSELIPEDNSKSDLENVMKEYDADMNSKNNNFMAPNNNFQVEDHVFDIVTSDV